jgi:hypothetical protein
MHGEWYVLRLVCKPMIANDLRFTEAPGIGLIIILRWKSPVDQPSRLRVLQLSEVFCSDT